MNAPRLAFSLLALFAAACSTPPSGSGKLVEDPRWLSYHGGDGPGRGLHVVLIAGDQEYRSEESLPMLARILATKHGFDCTVLFAQKDGLVDPTQKIRWEDKTVVHDIPGLEQLAHADLAIFFTRLLTLPDAQIRHVLDYLDSGKPVLAIRTANHGFLGNFPYEVGGKRVRFGEDVLGGAFLEHHGNWHADSTRGLLVEALRDHPILRGVRDLWGPSDVYRTFAKGAALPADCTTLVLGQPLLGRNHDDAPNPEKEALPIAWTKTWTGAAGKAARVFHVTMGSSYDFFCADLRRLVVNAAYWCVGREDRIAAGSDVDYVGRYEPHDCGFDYADLGVAPRPVASFR